MPEPATVTWTGLVPSTSGRKSKRTGQVREYRVTLFSDGTATCTCPAAIFRETRSLDTSPSSCKHIELARSTQGVGTVPAPPPRASKGPVKGTPSPAESNPDDFLDEFADDLLLAPPEVRHERRD